MAYEMREHARREDKVTVISNNPRFHFVPSNPWVAVNWRNRNDIEIDLARCLEEQGDRLHAVGAKRVHPAENRIELDDGQSVAYDYLVIATGPKLAFDEIPGLGPSARAVTPSRSATSIMRSKRKRLGRSSSRIPGPSSSAPCKERRATAPPTSSR